jgi:biopolymer transport protein ExbD
MRSMARVPDERIVEIAPDGSITLDGSFVTKEQLVSTLKNQHAAYPALKVAVRGDGGSSFQGVVDVMQAIRTSGVEQIGIAARRNYR